MPPPTVRAVFIPSGFQQCSGCHDLEACYQMGLQVGGRKTKITDPMCAMCFVAMQHEITIQLQVSDVLDVNERARRRGINKRAAKREKACAEEIGGRTTPASGSGTAKGDARTDEWMVDDKFTTSAETFPIKRTDVIKACGQACRGGRKAVLKVGFSDCDMAVLAWEDFLELCKS